eukprot:CAMPEP_0117463232 /NCGR_PEP_ID=MMETSP0784-20121206/3469_1 /TAXON_ID=39447 /ORGANISM="" /LENGTH=183 /DNA_ID=CAMNT_0005257033 /DNA_START=519 /DNA_END=1070 /DNA_ORIENTATION=+
MCLPETDASLRSCLRHASNANAFLSETSRADETRTGTSASTSSLKATTLSLRPFPETPRWNRANGSSGCALCAWRSETQPPPALPSVGEFTIPMGSNKRRRLLRRNGQLPPLLHRLAGATARVLRLASGRSAVTAASPIAKSSVMPRRDSGSATPARGAACKRHRKLRDRAARTEPGSPMPFW